jgi:hypothetical protein
MKFKEKCEECDHGITSDRHPNDPSSRDIECPKCEGIGFHELHDTWCTSEAEVLENYPSAYDVIMDARQTYWSPNDA